jgi:hypothetical protein
VPIASSGEEASLTQRQLGERLQKPQSWVHNCETANRRVDLTEFIAWAQACGVEALEAFQRFLDLEAQASGTAAGKSGDAEEPGADQGARKRPRRE